MFPLYPVKVVVRFIHDCVLRTSVSGRTHDACVLISSLYSPADLLLLVVALFIIIIITTTTTTTAATATATATAAAAAVSVKCSYVR